MTIKSTFDDKSFEELAIIESKSNKNEVFSLNYNNKKIWVKKARATLSSNLHKFYYTLFPFEVLLPVKQKTATEAILFESNKLIKFKSLGINTPNVLGVNNDFFAIEDCGKTIYSHIKSKDISEERMYFLIDKIIETLALIHNNNEYHGGAQCRNFTLCDEKIYVIDLEDSFDENIDLKLLQFRDLLLLLLSLAKKNVRYTVDYEYVINKYVKLTNNLEFIPKFKKLANKISFIITLSKIEFINNLMGKDVKGFLKLFETLRQLEKAKD